MIDIIGNITGVQYKKLIDFLLQKCDKVSFCIPNFDTVFTAFPPVDEISKYKEVKGTLNRNNPRFLEYNTKIQPLLMSLEKKIIKKWTDIEYYDECANYERDIYLLRFDKEVAEILKEIDGLYSWRYPNLPEDLFFFNNGIRYLKSVSHEKMCFFEDNSGDLISFLEKVGIEFEEW